VSSTDRKATRGAGLVAAAAAVVLVLLPVDWVHLGAGKSRWIWDDLPGRSTGWSTEHNGVGSGGSGGSRDSVRLTRAANSRLTVSRGARPFE
jgi:hypothetical protein